MRNLRPHIHRRLRDLYVPAYRVQAAAQNVASPLIHGPDLLDAILPALERDDGRNLNRRERPVIVITLDARQGGDEIAIAYHEADPPAGHVVALRQGEELHGHIFGARHL